VVTVIWLRSHRRRAEIDPLYAPASVNVHSHYRMYLINASAYRPIGRYRRSKHRKLMTSLELVADIPARIECMFYNQSNIAELVRFTVLCTRIGVKHQGGHEIAFNRTWRNGQTLDTLVRIHLFTCSVHCSAPEFLAAKQQRLLQPDKLIPFTESQRLFSRLFS